MANSVELGCTETGVLVCGTPGPWTVSGGTVTITGAGVDVTGGVTVDNSGAINLQLGATLNDDIIVGDTSAGSFDNNNSTHNVSGNLILGNQLGGSGTYTIEGDSAVTNVQFVAGGNGGNPNGALIIGNGGSGNFIQGTDVPTDGNNQVNVAGDLAIGHQPGSVGTYTLNSGTLTVGGQLSVGGQSTGANVFNQFDGAVVLTNSASSNPDYASVPPGSGAFGGKLAIGGGIDNSGGNAGGSGTYNLYGGSIDTTANGIEIGATGTGVMNHSGGTVNTTFLTLGFSGNGTYNLSDTGVINAFSEAVGYAGVGQFNQSGGTNNVSESLTIGANAAGNAPSAGPNTYNLTGGTLNTGNTIVGQGEQGSFVLNDSSALGTTHNVNGNLIVGTISDQSGPPPSTFAGNGSYTITGDTSQLNVLFRSGGNGAGNPNGALIIGDNSTATDASIGSFVQGSADFSDPNNKVNVAGDLIIGHLGSANNPSAPVADSVGSYTLNTGTLTVGGSIGVGAASLGNNVFTQNGGTVNITGSAQFNPDYVGVGTNDHTGELFLGGAAGPDNDGGSGTYNMNGGTLNVGLIEDGHAGIGVMNQTGGTVNASLWLGNAGGSSGTYNLSNGTLNAGDEAIGLSGGGSSVFNQTGGINNTGSLEIGNDYGTTGTYNLSGDPAAVQLNVSGGITVGLTGQGTFNQSGGTVTAGSLTMGTTGTIPNGSGIYNLTGNGQLGVSGDEVFGQFGYAEFNQGTVGDLGQTNNTVGGTLYLGAADNIDPNGGFHPREGVYTLNTGALATTNTVVGTVGVGVFTQNGGSHAISNQLVIGDQTIPADPTACGGTCTSGGPSNGTYNFNGGTLTVGGQVIVGNAGIGTFNQNADLDLSGSAGIVIGSQTGGKGTYNLASGATLIDDLVIGDAGTGTFNNNGGTHNVAGNLTLGRQTGGDGTYNLNSGGTLVLTDINSTMTIGDAGNGTFNVNGGSANIGYTKGGVMQIGVNGVGVVNQTAGDVKTDFVDLSIVAGGGSSSYTIGGNASLTVGANLGIAGGGQGSIALPLGDIAFPALPSTGTSYFEQNGNSTVTVGDTLYVNGSNGHDGFYFMNGGTLNVTNALNVDGDATSGGTFSLKGGNVTVLGNATVGGTGKGDIYVGSVATTSFTVDGLLTVGGSGNGEFTQNDGVVTAGSVVVGANTGGVGQYNLNGGTLNDSAIIGDAGTGTFNNAGATHNVTGDLILGNQSSGNGTYTLSAGGTTTVSGFTAVGVSGTGTFTNDGATHVTANLVLGANSGSVGTYTVQNGGAVKVGSASGDFLDVGESGTGTYTQNGAASSTTVSGPLDVGRFSGGTGTFNLNGGNVSVGTFAVVGDSGNGTLTQTGGSLTVANELDVGRAGGTGIYNLRSGNVTVTSGPLVVGGFAAGSVGTVNQTGGVANVNGNLSIGNSAATTGTYNLSVGTLTVSGNEIVGDAGTGTFNQTGGANNITGNLIIKNAGGTGEYDLSGGTLSAANITNNGTFNYSGGGAVTTGTLTNNGTATLSGSGTRAIAGNLTNSTTGTVNVNSTTATVSGNTTNSGAINVANSTVTFGAAGTTTTNNAGATIHVTNSSATFGGSFINNGGYKSDPSTSTFNQDLTIGSTGYLQGGPGDVFDLKGDFINNSTDSTDWNTGSVKLQFSTGTDAQPDDHNLYVNALTADGFLWGDLSLDGGNILHLLSNFGSGAALYVSDIDGLLFGPGNTVTNIFGDGFNIFYDPTVAGFTGQFLLQNGGCLTPDGTPVGDCGVGSSGGGGSTSVPEPATLLLFGAGIAGLATQRRKWKRRKETAPKV
ncbi:MAG TPA: PEP-CTERM sorting domain-containing protein [Micropepsaceae bacterium]|nr:PEP-CTERM sorting domain-containing protein [Micropepsaceae bacterium]